MRLGSLIRGAFIATVWLTNTAYSASSPTLQWNLEKALPHDASHFTQGLEIDGDRIFESAGRYGVSAVYEKNRDTGAVLRKHALDRRWFAEGLTVWNDELIVLTWRKQIAQVFDKLLQPTRRFHYLGEGWGLTHDATRLIMSDGSSTLTFRDPYTFQITGRVHVRDDGNPITELNELEFVDGWILANVWKSNRIAVINPADGAVHAWLDLSALHDAVPKDSRWDDAEYVLNGIAYDEQSRQLYVTGKCWPRMFVLRTESMPSLEEAGRH